MSSAGISWFPSNPMPTVKGPQSTDNTVARGGMLSIPATVASPTTVIKLLTIFSIALSFSVFSFGAAVLWAARQDAWDQAEHSASNLALALERDISRNISMYDLSLQGAIDVLQQPGLNSVPPELRQAALFDRAASAEYLGSILILDADGNVIADSTSMRPHAVSMADRDYFVAQKQNANIGLFVSVPHASRLRADDTIIALSRRISGPTGNFQGVVMGALRLAYFQRLFSNYNLGTSGRVSLIRSDGRLLARLPAEKGDFGRDLSQSRNFQRASAGTAGAFVGKASLDGVERLFSYRHFAHFPLIVTVGISAHDIYSAWWQKACYIGLVMAVLCSSTMALCLLFRREMIKRLAAETELKRAAERLAAAAMTDVLTGLGNRRHFDAAMEREWRQAIRSGTSLSLLLIDADHFKLYNDRYGHQNGDEVLRCIADCIDQSIRRPHDTGARYGGEEFVAILPETEIRGAIAIAERVCAAIAALDIVHADNAPGFVSVSIGVACAYPQFGQESHELVAIADERLYRAKQFGRNKICSDDADALCLPPSPATRS